MTTPMHGIVLCAGLGTRLRPLTQVLPKPVVPVGPVPAALRNAEQLLDAGIRSIHMNTHYLAEEVEAQVKAAAISRGWPRHAIRFWNEPEILETGGGIARIIHQCSQELAHSDFWDTVVVSGDIVADIPMKTMLNRWALRRENETSLMASVPLKTPRKDVTWVSADFSQIMGFGSDFSPDEVQSKGLHGRIFSNHQILSGQLVKKAAIQKRSSIDLFYRASLARGEKILHTSFQSDTDWFDIGTPESYVQCAHKLNLQSTLIQSIATRKVILVDAPVNADHALSHTPKQDCSNTTSTRLAHSNVSPSSLLNWQWLGHIHECPVLLREPLDALARTIVANFGSTSEQMAINCWLMDGNFLNKSKSHSHRGDHLANGFFDLKAYDSASPKIELPHPLLVRLDTLGLTNPQATNSHQFWLLIH